MKCSIGSVTDDDSWLAMSRNHCTEEETDNYASGNSDRNGNGNDTQHRPNENYTATCNLFLPPQRQFAEEPCRTSTAISRQNPRPKISVKNYMSYKCRA